jgi:alanine-synthesizing transaminase
MFSRRSDWDAAVNRLTRATLDRRKRGDAILDLTLSNPTRAGIRYPHDELSEVMARAATVPYDPQPLGIRSAREAVARELGADSEDIVITASTSEAYSFLFKLLTDPGDEILTAVPSYPLLEHLATLELVQLKYFPLEFHRRWELHAGRVAEHLTDRTRAIVLVSPNNPTGSFVRADELSTVAALRKPLIVDEVFREYAFAEIPPWSSRHDVLTFSLGGLSKSAGLPHYKLGWIRLSGPEAEKQKARHALELIADNFLSVSTPVQAALPELLRIGATIRKEIADRTRANLQLLSALDGAVRALPVEGGWSAILRVPRTRSDEDLVLDLLDNGVLVQPGYFFDFESEGFIVVSLLTPQAELAAGMERLVPAVSR